ncbi:MAG: hypothetical protein K2K31_01165, partial [Clostridia bacterium]|nr:hypothetical protein [Clostridia bacterium]
SQLRDDGIKELYYSTAGKTPMDFNAVQLFEIAEYYLSQNDFYKVMTGIVNAPMGIKQNMRGVKFKTDGKFVYNKLSPSTNSMSPAIHSQVKFDIGDNNEVKEVKINSNVNILNPDNDPKNGYRLSYNESDFEVFPIEKYVETFNTQPTSYLPYIISSKVCPASTVSKVKANGDDTYSFEINLSGDYLSFSALYYSYEIKFSSGFEKLPKWDSLKMTVTVDSSFRFVSIGYLEKYKMYVSGLGYMAITDDFIDVFQYDNLPSYQSVCDGEVK